MNPSGQSVVIDLYDIVASRDARTEVGWSCAQRTGSNDRHLAGIVTQPVLLFEAVRPMAMTVKPDCDAGVDQQLNETGVEEVFVTDAPGYIVMPTRPKAPTCA
ncbi:hypothetical protein RU07_18450 [Agrobacterium tumefaciens]|uniref:Uncharacterized protein n=1 Tax=Agrobacterium tumefaciens TaxID=358 RepID=A0A0D0KJR9_AGRTU|nr:hypothetical protein RU07_18450 [Agrobacterium tumefaciens]